MNKELSQVELSGVALFLFVKIFYVMNWRIGEKATITKRTLYHYEELGLPAPAFVDQNRY